jgi:NagD protein
MRGYFLDIQGTLIDDKDFLPLPGAVEFCEYLTKKNIPFILLTNNTKRDSKEFIEYLKNLGFKFKHYLDPLMVMDEKIKGKVAVFGNEKFCEIVKSRFIIDYKNPDYVLLGLKLFNNEEFAKMIELLLNGAKLAGMHKTSLYSKNDKRYPGLGAILEMLKYATDKDYEVFGKPSFEFFKRASEEIGLNFDKITIISDDLKGDLLPAKKLGMKTVLVLSGKVKKVDEITQKPDLICKNIKEYMEKCDE